MTKACRGRGEGDMGIHADLQHEPLDLAAVIDRVRSPSAGAIVTFTGTTRDTFNGNRVLHLDYEAHEKMALKSLTRILETATRKWELMGAACVHRLGRVDVGEESIVIAVSSAHRKAAWEAGEWILNAAKRETEVWKKETFYNASELEQVWKANEEFARRPDGIDRP